jgi:hypothetical protein
MLRSRDSVGGMTTATDDPDPFDPAVLLAVVGWMIM